MRTIICTDMEALIDAAEKDEQVEIDHHCTNGLRHAIALEAMFDEED